MVGEQNVFYISSRLRKIYKHYSNCNILYTHVCNCITQNIAFDVVRDLVHQAQLYVCGLAQYNAAPKGWNRLFSLHSLHFHYVAITSQGPRHLAPN